MSAVADPYEWTFRPGDTFSTRYLAWVMAKEDLPGMFAAIRSAPEVAFDLETTGLDEHAAHGGDSNGGVAARVVMMTLTLQPWPGATTEPTTYVVPLSHPDSPFVGVWRRVLRAISQRLRGRRLVAHNGKFDCRWIHALTGVDLSADLYWDTLGSCALLDENDTGKLKPRAADLFGIERWDDVELKGPGAAERVPFFDLGLYAARDTYWTFRLYHAHRHILWVERDTDEVPGEDDPDDLLLARLGELALAVTMPTIRTLTALEQRGIGLDADATQEALEAAHAEADRIREELAGRYVGVDGLDPSEVSLAPTSKWFRAFTTEAVERRELAVVAMTGAGVPQWNAAVLKKLARTGYPLAEDLLVQRDMDKRAQFLTSWLEKVTPAGRIHASYHAGRVVTGRLSSCLSPDTLIDMPRDMVKYPDGVPMREVKPGDWVYSFDHRCELTLRQVEWVGPTKVAETVYVTFENSDGDRRTLQATPDHLVRLYNGDYRPAEYLLNSGSTWGGSRPPRVMGMVRRQWKNPGQNDNYLTFFPHANARQSGPRGEARARGGSRGGGRSTEHRWVMSKVQGRTLSTKFDVNHIDGAKANNTPSNLEYLPASEHRAKSFVDGTRGATQEWPEVFTGKTDWRAVSITPGPVIEVWDMTVPEDHCFVANGIVVHNSDPNMQQVSGKLKPSFVPAPGYVLAEIDYSQIELRVAAMLSGCVPMIEAFQRGDDLHRLFGARLAHHDDPADVTKDERQKAKSANFGLLYGMGPVGFQTYAETAYGVEMTSDEAHRVHAEFFDMWTGLTDWHERQKRMAHRLGYVTSPIGRVRHLPEVMGYREDRVAEAERQAVNAPVQGLGSDIMQMAAASIEGYLAGHQRLDGVRLVGTVHDSIVLELEEGRWRELAEACLHRMTEAIVPNLEYLGLRLTVPLAAEATVGRHWGDDSLGVLER